MPLGMLRREPQLGQALQHARDRPVRVTGTWKSLGQARFWDSPFTVLGTDQLLGQALQNAWDRPALGIGPHSNNSRNNNTNNSAIE